MLKLSQTTRDQLALLGWSHWSVNPSDTKHTFAVGKGITVTCPRQTVGAYTRVCHLSVQLPCDPSDRAKVAVVYTGNDGRDAAQYVTGELDRSRICPDCGNFVSTIDTSVPGIDVDELADIVTRALSNWQTEQNPRA